MAKKGKPVRKAKSPAKAVPSARPARKVRPIPEGYHTITAHLVVDDAAGAIDFYKKALGAKERLRMSTPDGRVLHAEVEIGDSVFMLADEMDPMPGQPGLYKSPKSAGLTTGAMFLYVTNVDAAFDRAVKAGCTVRAPVADMFWGDRFGQVIDPFGHTWGFATHTEDLSPKDMQKRQQEFFKRHEES
jgi:PhnB protein